MGIHNTDETLNLRHMLSREFTSDVIKQQSGYMKSPKVPTSIKEGMKSLKVPTSIREGMKSPMCQPRSERAFTSDAVELRLVTSGEPKQGLQNPLL